MVSWSTLELGWCDTLDLPRFQSSTSVPKNEIRSKDLKISKIKSLADDLSGKTENYSVSSTYKFELKKNHYKMHLT